MHLWSLPLYEEQRLGLDKGIDSEHLYKALASNDSFNSPVYIRMCLNPKETRPREFKAALAYSMRLLTKAISEGDRSTPFPSTLSLALATESPRGSGTWSKIAFPAGRVNAAIAYYADSKHTTQLIVIPSSCLDWNEDTAVNQETYHNLLA